MKRGVTEHPQPKDTFTADSGAKLVARVMAKAEASHARGDSTGPAMFKLGTNQAKHVSGADNKGGFGE
jgi:hypothetical protein